MNQGPTFFAIQESGQPYIYETIYEIEMDMVRESISVKKTSSSSYTVIEKVYSGYWGVNKTNPNFKIIYKIKKNAVSDYGYIVQSIKIKRI